MLQKEPGLKDIKEALNRIGKHIHQTPVLRNRTIEKLVGCELFFKCENFQKIGAFKARGALNTALSLSNDQSYNGIATHSSGNHAQAIAYAASIVGTKAFIVMPRNAPEVKVNAVRDYGAEIIFCEPNLEARERTLREIVEKTAAYFIHPYNDYNVIAGQATASYELIQEIPGLDFIVTPVGGGGLLSGTVLSSRYTSIATKVIAGEPEGADDAYQSFKKGKIVPSINPNTIADGLLTSLGDKTFNIIKSGVENIYLVNDEEIVSAMKLIWERMKIIVEPSGAVPLATVLKNKDTFLNKKIGIIISGGNVDLSKNYFI